MVMSNFELGWGQAPVGEDVYLLDPSISGSGLMQSASRVRGTRHRGCAWASYFKNQETTQPTESCSRAGFGPRRWRGGG